MSTFHNVHRLKIRYDTRSNISKEVADALKVICEDSGILWEQTRFIQFDTRIFYDNQGK